MGPTDNLRQTDHFILQSLNLTAEKFFKSNSDLNHILAQVYHNTKSESEESKDHKAKIKAHSDKTKDMPVNGLMAFCTFYKDISLIPRTNPSKSDRFDWCYKGTSILTKLRFKLKSCVRDPNLAKQFDIILYPNSVFFMSLSTNRLYTHEIVPSGLQVEYLPIRMGYVVRCSKTLAVHKSGETFIKETEQLVKLCQPDNQGIDTLKELYYKENNSDELIEYPKLYFSLNQGDYLEPHV